MDRYARQRLLAPVGEQGQQRLAAAQYCCASTTAVAAEVARDYLGRAGAVHFVSAAAAAASAFTHAATFRHAAARDF
ncbi:MAG TPA: hypothetical protein VIW29_12010, partial [Polyangiaceae bacterium]